MRKFHLFIAIVNAIVSLFMFGCGIYLATCGLLSNEPAWFYPAVLCSVAGAIYGFFFKNSYEKYYNAF